MAKEKYLYHITKKENLPGILQEGLKPQVGDKSKLVHEKTPFVYLCRRKDLPYWKIILGESVVLKIQLDKSNCQENILGNYNEYRYKNIILPEEIVKVYTPKPSKFHMRKLCFGYLWSLNFLTLQTAIYYTYKNEKRSTTLCEEELHLFCDAFIAVMDNLDYSVLAKKEVRDFLKYLGENGEYTFLDEYLGTGKRLYEQLILFPEDSTFEKRRKIYNYIKKNLSDCLTLYTGGWTG